VNLGEDPKVCLLVVIGVREDGCKELLAVEDGYRESEDSWASAFRDLRDRGMNEPHTPNLAILVLPRFAVPGSPCPIRDYARAARSVIARRLGQFLEASAGKRRRPLPSRRGAAFLRDRLLASALMASLLDESQA
jgi:Transposase, Mutator family